MRYTNNNYASVQAPVVLVHNHPFWLQVENQIKGISGTVHPAVSVGGGAVLRAVFTQGRADAIVVGCCRDVCPPSRH